MRVVYGYLVTTDGFDSADATNQLLDAVRDEEGIPRGEWRPAHPDASLAALGVYVEYVPGDDYSDVEMFVLSTGAIEVPDGDPELLPAPTVPWLDWAHQTLRLPDDADVDGPRWFDVADELAGAALPPPVASIASAALRRTVPSSPGISAPAPGLPSASPRGQ
ncbi:hypothetical protein AB0M46_49085 [Dactylosporangium sp. NPDC051485]|uniref:hypothetical protein n=1 Tax=Dactylosporangium sp. NPDC051485 TaxID=3154846 RepID=UPI00341EC7A2